MNPFSFDDLLFEVVAGQGEQFFGGHHGVPRWKSHKQPFVARAQECHRCAGSVRFTATLTAQYLNSGILPSGSSVALVNKLAAAS